jgi:predicted metal-dependent phosphoesterase TrpH
MVDDFPMPQVRIDCHVHTRVSPDALDAPERMVDAARAVGLDGIAITDHDRAGAYEHLCERGLADPRGHAVDGFLVIPGVEVSTRQGHVIVLGATFATPDRPGGIDAAALVRDVHEQSLLAVAAHPFERSRAGVGQSVLERVGFDAIEVFNSKSLEPGANIRAAAWACRLRLPALAGSDAHFAETVGRAHTLVDTRELSVAAVLEAVRAGRTAIHAASHTPAEIARYWARGWFTRPWVADWIGRAAARTGVWTPPTPPPRPRRAA